MKSLENKKIKFILINLFLLILYSMPLISGDILINEIMYSPDAFCGGTYNEWVELYNPTSEDINLDEWKIGDEGGIGLIDFSNSSSTIIESQDYFIIAKRPINFSQYFNVLCPIAERKFTLNNDEDTIFLYDSSGELIQNISYNFEMGGAGDGNSLQLINNIWISAEPTPGLENKEDNSSNNSNNQTNPGNAQALELNWEEDEIINNQEFEIEVKIYNSENKQYDLKIWIETKEDTKIISERYDDENNEWKSGNYYIYNFFQGPGNKTKIVFLKMRSDYENFSGNAKIYAKIKDSEIIIEKEIEILEKQENPSQEFNNSENQSDLNYSKSENQNLTEDSIIYLGAKNNLKKELKSNSKLIYESKQELIKKYMGYIFLLLIFFIGIILLRKFNKKKKLNFANEKF